MARQLLLQAPAQAGAASSGGPAALVLVVLVVAAVATVVVSLCTSSRSARPGKQRGLAPRPREEAEEDGSGGGGGKGRQLLASLSGIGGGKAVAKMESWNRRSPPREEGGGRKGRQLLASLSGIGGKAAAAVGKMASWNRRSPPAGRWSSDDDEGEAVVGVVEEDALWKKTIIMGDRCRPLEFSGHIAYDSDGNMLPPPPPPPATEMIKKGPAAADTAVN